MRTGRCGRACRIGGFVIATLLVSGCHPAVLDPKGVVGTANSTILIDSVIIMLAIVIPTIAATLGFAWWFRAGNRRARHRPTWAYSGRIELVVWAVPLLVIILLGGVAWVGSHELDPATPITSKTAALEVDVVSLDWKWLFIYPEQHIASVNELTIPAGRPIHFRLTSASVMNAFFIPQLGSMIYTMNGMSTQLYLQADQPGDFHGLSSHYSGDGFAGMHFEVHATPPDQFATWAAAARARGPVLDPVSYGELAQQSRDVVPFTYRDVAPHLFDDIANQKMAPAPGPAVRNGAEVANGAKP
jgi:cytochrome o ubiquinol oxidase subunit 2